MKESAVVKTLIKHGNSYALVIDKPILELLRATPDTPLELTTNGDTLTISPIRDAERQRRFEEAMEKVNKRYSNVFKRLAK